MVRLDAQGQRVDCAEVVALQVGIEQQLGHFLPCYLLKTRKRDLIAQKIQHHLLGLRFDGRRRHVIVDRHGGGAVGSLPSTAFCR